MTRSARELFYADPPAHRSGLTSDRLATVPELSDDPVLEFAYTLAEFAITVVGPLFWMCLASLFLMAELAG